MKTTLIGLLLVALAAAAFFTRPSEASFRQLVEQKITAKTGGGAVGATLGTLAGSAYAGEYTYRDHYLWVSVKENGKTRYVGAFAHWFSK